MPISGIRPGLVIRKRWTTDCKTKWDGLLPRIEKRWREASFGPLLAWFVVVLVSAAGVFAGLNMMYGAIAGRGREIATLQTIGFRRRAILLSLIQEGVLLASAASLLSGFIAVTMLNGMAVRFTMGAFTLRIDSICILVGFSAGLLLGVLGTLPPAFKALRESVAKSLKAI